MLTIINNENDPYYNLALEEWLLKSGDAPDALVWLWQNRSAVIVGRHQNATEEVNLALTEARGIDVVRRISGGGAVYHDFGNVNFTFTAPFRGQAEDLFRQFTAPVIAALRSFSVPAEFSGRNDIVVCGKKVSGNAQAYYRDRMFHHGTILFDSDLDAIDAVLNVAPDKIQAKGVKSVRSRVTNVRPFMREDITVSAFMERLLAYLLGTDDIEARTFRLAPEAEAEVRRLAAEKYRTWEWNHGHSPFYNVTKSARFAGGKVAFYLHVQDGLIASCRIRGDFFSKLDIEGLEAALTGVAFTPEAVGGVLTAVPLDDYIFNVSRDELIGCLFPSAV